MDHDHSARIAEHAYRLWEKEGCPDGKSLDHWLEAEAAVSTPSEVKAEVPKRTRSTSAATKAKTAKSAEATPAKAAAKAKPARAPRTNGRATS